jgi:LPS sulfotransferase NodH
MKDFQRQKIREWLVENKRKCPICGAGGEKLMPVEIFETLSPGAATATGINTSKIVHYAKIVCQTSDCRFEAELMDLEDSGLF